MPATIARTKEVLFAVGDPPTSFECQFTNARLNDTTEPGGKLWTLCPDGVVYEEADDNFELVLAGYSDWSDTGFSQWAWENRGRTVDFTFTTHSDKPTQARVWSGRAKILATGAGGEARTNDMFDLTWPVLGTPTQAAPTPAV